MMSTEKGFADIAREILPYIGVAAVCGLYTSAKRGWTGCRQLALSLAGSSICGALTGWWMMSLGSSPYAIGAVCGVAGLLGDRGLQMLMESLIKRIRGEYDGKAN